MPFDTLGGTRATMDSVKCHSVEKQGGSLKLCLDWDSLLQFSDLNQESLVGAVKNTAPNTSLPFVHTARRFFRLVLIVNDEDSFD